MRILAAAGVALGLLLAAGLVRFASARPSIEVRFPRLAARSAERANLAHFTQGPLVRVSSAEWGIRHHPGYLVDGHQRPILLEKWVSDRRDREPWAEVKLEGPRDVDEVALELAGAREPAQYTMRRFTVECFRGPASVARAEVQVNDSPRPRVRLACPQVDRVRVTFATEPRTPRDVARVFELEVWGR